MACCVGNRDEVESLAYAVHAGDITAVVIFHLSIDFVPEEGFDFIYPVLVEVLNHFFQTYYIYDGRGFGVGCLEVFGFS